MIRTIKKMLSGLWSFSELIARMVNASDSTTCISLNNQQCMAQSTLINLDPNDYKNYITTHLR